MLDPTFDKTLFLNQPASTPFRRRIMGGLFATALCVILSLYVFLISAPADFPANTTLLISPGWGLTQTALYLKEKHVIRSKFAYKSFVVLFGTVRNISAGDYFFPVPENVWQIARDLARGNHRSPLSKVTIPEGMTIAQIAKLFPESAFSLFDPKQFLALAKGKEGYLFPDTYYFSADLTASSAVQEMSDTFFKKTRQEEEQSLASGRKFSDVVTMASILEEEANDDQSMRIVAGILWKRLKLGIPLQVDATLKYVTGRGTSQLTESDLALKSPYNTYIHAGLPPAPISNPGIAALEAALNPSVTPYLYFLTDTKGAMHYAVTLDQHVANKQKYLP